MFFITKISKILNYIIFQNYKHTLYFKKEVISGPFRGIKYSKAMAGGDILPQLLGSYESELIPFINSISNNKYQNIYNIGAGDGYYAIGFSNIFPKSKITAFEIDNYVYSYLVKNVEYNSKSNQIFCLNQKANNTIFNIKPNDRNLIFSDCEGCEHEIFNNLVIKNLSNCDLIIEIHTKSFEKTDIEKNLEVTHKVQRIGYGDSRMIDIKVFESNDLNLGDFAKIGRENRSKFHYFLCAISKNFE